jgi:hypothetical protein
MVRNFLVYGFVALHFLAVLLIKAPIGLAKRLIKTHVSEAFLKI